MLQIPQNVYIYLCYLFNTSHFRACDTCLGFLLVVVGVGLRLFLHHSRGPSSSHKQGIHLECCLEVLSLMYKKKKLFVSDLELQVAY